MDSKKLELYKRLDEHFGLPSSAENLVVSDLLSNVDDSGDEIKTVEQLEQYVIAGIESIVKTLLTARDIVREVYSEEYKIVEAHRKAKATEDVKRFITFTDQLEDIIDEKIRQTIGAAPLSEHEVKIYRLGGNPELAEQKLREGKIYLIYSAWDTQGVNNLNDVPVKGKFRIWYIGWGDDTYKSEVLDSPTWLDLCVECEKAIRHTKDFHHVFLEGLELIVPGEERADGIPIYEFRMGS